MKQDDDEKKLTVLQGAALAALLTYGTLGFLFWLFGG